MHGTHFVKVGIHGHVTINVLFNDTKKKQKKNAVNKNKINVLT